MNPMEKMMLEEKKLLKEKIIKLFDSFSRENFTEALEEVGYSKLQEYGTIHSYSIDLDIDDNDIYVYIDNELSLVYKINK